MPAASSRPDPRCSPGRPGPLGAHWDGSGVNVAVHAGQVDAVELCLFDADGTETRVRLPDRTGRTWHGYLPGIGPGQRYGFRVHGPWAPGRGLRYNPRKLLLDPYARAVGGPTAIQEVAVGGVDVPDQRDSAGAVPFGYVVDESFDWAGDTPPRVPWDETVLYELHVKGFTAAHPDLPPALRGRYAGLGSEPVIAHLTSLGVTTVELLPVQHFLSELPLAARGLSNYWGYNPIGWFAPHAGYAADPRPGAAVAEFKAMVAALHAAGIEVVLDVVYNHTAEGSHVGPTLSLRGLDNPAYYRLEPNHLGRYRDFTGCGNALDARNPHALALILDSLRYWVTQMHVDGFRFDLASTLVRGQQAPDPMAPFLGAIAADPVLRSVKLIAEPWDVGGDGYQVGGFPAPWVDWNDRYRNGVRDFWRGGSDGLADLATLLSGSAGTFVPSGRGPLGGLNFVTCHDGFTLADLVAHDRKHNDANGEQGRDGSDDNRSWNCGTEGPTPDPQINRLRRRQRRNLLGTLLLSAGVPMLLAGDERGHSQGGNNNAYCQDSELTWLDWSADGGADDLTDFVARLLALRRKHPVLRQRRFFRGRPFADDTVADLSWFDLDAGPLAAGDWSDGSRQALGAFFSGDGIRSPGAQGERVRDASFYLLLNAGRRDERARLPGPPWAAGYRLVVDTAAEGPAAELGADLPAGDEVALAAHSLLLLRADRPTAG